MEAACREVALSLGGHTVALSLQLPLAIAGRNGFRRTWRASDPPDPHRRPTMPGPSDDQIRVKAYEIWVAEGRPHGRDHDHWLMARAELEIEMPKPKKPAALKTKAAETAAKIEKAEKAKVEKPKAEKPAKAPKAAKAEPKPAKAEKVEKAEKADGKAAAEKPAAAKVATAKAATAKAGKSKAAKAVPATEPAIAPAPAAPVAES